MDLSKAKEQHQKMKNLARNGVWRDYGDGGGRLLIAHFSHPEVVRVLMKYNKMEDANLQNSNGRISVRGTMSQEDIDKQRKADMIPVIAEHILLGWENIEVDNKPYEYSKENAIKLLSDEGFDFFMADVMNLSRDEEAYRLEEIEDTGKKPESE